MTSKKISDFTAQSTFQSGDQLNIVRSSTNFKIDVSNLASFLGVTGTIQPVGSGSAIPVLEQPSATSNNIRGVESGSGILASISAQNGITLKHNFTFDKTGQALVVDETIASPVFKSIVAGSGISVGTSGNTIVVSASAVGASNTVVVNQESDFPTAVGGVITLTDNTNYILGANVTTANRFVLGLNNSITANNIFNPVLTYTGSGVMFTGVDKNLTISDISLNCASGTAFDISSTVAPASFFVMDSVIVQNCAKFANFNDMFTVVIRNSGSLNATTGITVAGTNYWSIFSIDRLNLPSTSASFIGIDLGSSTHQTLELDNLVFRAPAGAKGLKGLASSGNITANNLATCLNSEFSGGLTPLDTITQNDIRWDFQRNTGVADTITDALLGFNGNATETAISVATTPVLVNATWVLEDANKFTTTTGGRATYNGERDSHLPVDVAVGVVAVGGGNKNCSLYIAKNGTVITSTKRTVQTSGSTPRTWSIPWQLTLSNGDYIEVFVANDTDTVNLIVEHAVLRIN